MSGLYEEKKTDWVKYLKGTGRTGLLVLKTTWLTVWTLYQIVLGVILVMSAWAVIKVGDYYKLWDIRDLRTGNPASTAFIDSEKDRILDSVRAAGARPPDTLIQWTWIPLDSIPKQVQELALVAEDAKFYDHQGFDLEEIEYAMVSNHQAGKKFRGASTITQQVAKNLYLSKEREMSRKLREAVITVELEHFLSKDRILELYLNVAQFDARVFGIRAAAKHYFNKSPAQLSQEETVSLISLLPNPVKWSLAFRKPNAGYLQHKRLVMKNYAMLKGIRQDNDTATGLQAVFSDLAEELSDEKWKSLRSSRPVSDQSGDTSGDSRRDTASDGGSEKHYRTF